MSKKHFYYPIIDKRLADVRVPEDDLAISLIDNQFAI